MCLCIKCLKFLQTIIIVFDILIIRLQSRFYLLQISLCKNPNQGSALPLHLRKVRLGIASKGKGTRGGARVIIRYSIVDGVLRFIYIYDKSEMANVRTDFLKDILKELDN